MLKRVRAPCWPRPPRSTTTTTRPPPGLAPSVRHGGRLAARCVLRPDSPAPIPSSHSTSLATPPTAGLSPTATMPDTQSFHTSGNGRSNGRCSPICCCRQFLAPPGVADSLPHHPTPSHASPAWCLRTLQSPAPAPSPAGTTPYRSAHTYTHPFPACFSNPQTHTRAYLFPSLVLSL